MDISYEFGGIVKQLDHKMNHGMIECQQVDDSIYYIYYTSFHYIQIRAKSGTYSVYKFANLDQLQTHRKTMLSSLNILSIEEGRALMDKYYPTFELEYL